MATAAGSASRTSTDVEAGEILRSRRRTALAQAGITQGELAARIGVSRQSVGLVLAGHHRSRRVEQAIADACGIDAAELFPPERHAPHQTPALGTTAAAATEEAEVLPKRERVGQRTGASATESLVGGLPAVPRSEPPSELEQRVEAELRRIAADVFLAMVEQGLPVASPAVRAVAAALRELTP